jgi:hypothetical protein
MAKCVYCHQRKGKRSCPALGGEICTTCCGEHRGKEIRCPNDCVYFIPHEAYQRERAGELFAQQWRQFHAMAERRWGENGPRLALFLTLTLYQHFVDQPSPSDSEALAGIALLRQRLSPIHLPGVQSTPFGDLLMKETEAFLKQVPIDSATRADCLEAYLKMLADFSGSEIASNQALRGVIGFVQKYFPDAVKAMTTEKTPPGRIVRV